MTMFTNPFTPYGFRFFEGEGGNGGGTPEKKTEDLNPEEKDKGEKVPLGTLIEERKKRQAIEVERDTLLAKQKALDEEELKKKGELQKLIDAKELELKAEREKVASLQSKATEYEALQAIERAEIKKALGTDWEEEFDSMPLPTLKKIAIKLGSAEGSKIPKGDGGIDGDGKVKLTDEDKAQAQQMGLSDEAYARFLKTSEKLKPKK